MLFFVDKILNESLRMKNKLIYFLLSPIFRTFACNEYTRRQQKIHA